MKIVYYICGAMIVATLAVVLCKGLAGHDYMAKVQSILAPTQHDPETEKAVNEGCWIQVLDHEFTHPHDTLASPGSNDLAATAHYQLVLQTVADMKPNDPVALNNYALALINDYPIPFDRIIVLLRQAQNCATNDMIGTVVQMIFMDPTNESRVFALQHGKSQLTFVEEHDDQRMVVMYPGTPLFIDQNEFNVIFSTDATGEFSASSLIARNINCIERCKASPEYFHRITTWRRPGEVLPKDAEAEEFIIDLSKVRMLRPQSADTIKSTK